MSGKLSANFSFSFEGNIWNMLLDEVEGTLILEIRENDNHQVSFTAIDLNNGTILWDGLQFEENWWVGMTTISQGMLILHTFHDNTDPEPKGLLTFDIKKKKVRWLHENFTFLKLIDSKIFGFGMTEQEKEYQSIDLFEGERKKIEEDQFFKLKLSLPHEKKINWLTIYPLHYKEDTTYFETCKRYLYNRLHLQPVKAIEYLEYKDRIIISYYTSEDKSLVNYLLVMDLDGEIFYNDAIQKNIDAVGLETFFIVKNQVIFVKEKNEIFSFTL